MDVEWLRQCRERIDEIDGSIAALLSQRADVAREVGKAKGDAPVYDPAREGEVIARAAEACPGVERGAVERIYREIISVCRGVQHRPKVAFLGPEGSFSHEGALAAFGGAIDLLPCLSFVDVFTAVGKRSADWGVVPAENSLEGTVLPTMDAFSSSDKNICIQSEVSIVIDHNLASSEKNLDAIREVSSHPQALGQCREWLRTNLPSAAQIPAGSTSAAAASVAGARGRAAVGRAAAGEGRKGRAGPRRPPGPPGEDRRGRVPRPQPSARARSGPDPGSRDPGPKRPRGAAQCLSWQRRRPDRHDAQMCRIAQTGRAAPADPGRRCQRGGRTRPCRPGGRA